MKAQAWTSNPTRAFRQLKYTISKLSVSTTVIKNYLITYQIVSTIKQYLIVGLEKYRITQDRLFRSDFDRLIEESIGFEKNIKKVEGFK